MFDNEFYPTPYSLFESHIKKYIIDKDYRDVFDPSAGKGDLLNYVGYGNNGIKKYAIEKSMELCSVMRENKITVLGHDFFQYAGEHSFDLVIMNPPFSNAADHFLHAVQVCSSSDIICILPASLFEREDKKSLLIKDIIAESHGELECAVSPFFVGDAERKTKVDICIVYIERKKNKEGFFSFDPDKDKEVDFGVIDQQSGLVKRDMIKQLVTNYQEATVAFKEMVIARAKLQSCTNDAYKLNDMIHASFNEPSSTDKDGPRVAYNHFVDSIKAFFWNSIFTEGKFYQFMTKSVLKDFAEFQKVNGQLSFSEDNINMVLGSLFDNRENILKKNIEEVFDLLTSYHKENRCYFEGWKTNDRWKVKRKFILPMTVEYSDYRGWSTRYYRFNELRDIDIAMCSVSGKTMDKIKTIDKTINKEAVSRDTSCVYSEFFKIKLYLKGTAHFEFLDEDLYNIFNREACGAKKWLCE